MKRKELKEKRTSNMKVFENQDHSCTAEIYLDAVHYEENGTWQDMDDRLFEETDEKSYVNKKGNQLLLISFIIFKPIYIIFCIFF